MQVSTVGLVPELRRFAAAGRGRLQLALSLHATTDEVSRSRSPDVLGRCPKK